MNCKKCGGDLNENSKFCRFCGQNQELDVVETATEQPATGGEKAKFDFSKVNMPDVDLSQLKSNASNFAQTVQSKTAEVTSTLTSEDDGDGGKKKKLLIIGGAVAAVVLVVAVAAVAILNSPANVVKKALVSTGSSISSEMEGYLEDLYIIDYFSGLTSDKYSFEVELDHDWIGTQEVLIQSDLGSKQLKIEPSIMGMDMSIMASEKYITFEADDILDDVYGIDLTTLADDLDDADYIDVDLDDFDQSMYDGMMDFDYEAMVKSSSEIVSGNMTTMLKSLEVEKEGKESLRINGNSIEATGYSVYLPVDALEVFLVDTVEELFEDESFVEYIDFYYATQGQKMDAEDLMDDMLDAMDDIVDAYDDVVDDLEIMCYVYSGRVVSIYVEGDDVELTMDFNPKGNVMDYIALTVDNDGYEEEIVFESSFDGSEFTAELTVETPYYSREYGVEYDMDSTRKNLTFWENDDELVFSVDGTTKNALSMSFEYDGFEITIDSEKNSLDSKWFSQPSDFENILQMDEDELQEVMYEMAMSASMSSSSSTTNTTTSTTTSSSAASW